MDKSEKRRRLNDWKAQQKERARADFPLPETELDQLFDHLDQELRQTPCDHSLRLTRQWMAKADHSPEQVVPWLNEHGGYCDCEVLANVEDHFEQNRADG